LDFGDDFFRVCGVADVEFDVDVEFHIGCDASGV
jgi:hypothetical protein